MNAVLGRLREKSVTVNRQKCEECTQTLNVLGRTITPDGISPQREIVDRILSLPPPTSHKELQSLRGLSGYHRAFIDHYSDKVKQMQALLSAVDFKWTKECDQELQSMKNKLAEQPILATHSILPVEIPADASISSVAALIESKARGVCF